MERTKGNEAEKKKFNSWNSIIKKTRMRSNEYECEKIVSECAVRCVYAIVYRLHKWVKMRHYVPTIIMNISTTKERKHSLFIWIGRSARVPLLLRGNNYSMEATQSQTTKRISLIRLLESELKTVHISHDAVQHVFFFLSLFVSFLCASFILLFWPSIHPNNIQFGISSQVPLKYKMSEIRMDIFLNISHHFPLSSTLALPW